MLSEKFFNIINALADLNPHMGLSKAHQVLADQLYQELFTATTEDIQRIAMYRDPKKGKSILHIFACFSPSAVTLELNQKKYPENLLRVLQALSKVSPELIHDVSKSSQLTALHYAAMTNNSIFIQTLTAAIGIDRPHDLEKLLNATVDRFVNIKATHLSALHIASAFGSTEAISELIKSGATHQILESINNPQRLAYEPHPLNHKKHCHQVIAAFDKAIREIKAATELAENREFSLDLQSEVNNLHSQINVLRPQLEAATAANAELQNLLDQSRQFISHLQETTHQSQTHMTTLEDQLKVAAMKEAKLNHLRASDKALILKLQKDLSEQAQQMTELNSQLQAAIEQSTELTQLKKTITSLTIELGKVKIENSTMAVQISHYQEQITQLRNRIENQESRHQQSIAEIGNWKKKHDASLKLRKELASKLLAAETHCKVQTTALAEAHKKHMALEASHKDIEQRYQALTPTVQANQMQTQLAELIQHNNELMNEVHTTKARLYDLETQQQKSIPEQQAMYYHNSYLQQHLAFALQQLQSLQRIKLLSDQQHALALRAKTTIIENLQGLLGQSLSLPQQIQTVQPTTSPQLPLSTSSTSHSQRSSLSTGTPRSASHLFTTHKSAFHRYQSGETRKRMQPDSNLPNQQDTFAAPAPTAKAPRVMSLTRYH